MRNKHKEKRMAQEENPGAPEGRTGRLRGWSDSDDGGQVELKPKRKKRRAVTTTLEHELEEGGHFQAHATHLGQPGTCEEEPKVRRKQATAPPKEKKQKKGCEKESKAEVRQRAKLPAKEEKRKDKKEKKRKKDHADYPEAYGMMGQAMLAPMMGMMRSMSYPMMPGMMMMPGGIIGAPLMGGVGHMGMPGAPTMPYPLPGVPLVRPLAKARTKAEDKKRRFTEAPAPPEPEPAEVEPVPEPVEEPVKRSASVSSSSSSSSTSEAKNEGPPTVPVEATVPLPASEEHTFGEGELELGLISPEEGKEEHSPLQVPPGMESPVASQSPDPEASRLNRPSSWVEVEGETMEELQRELEVTSQSKPCASIGTQTEEAPEDLSASGLGDRWFLGFVDVVPMPGTKESSGSSDSSDEEEETTCRPERQLRRRSRSQSQGQGLESKPTGDAAEASSSSSSSSSSSGGSRKRQRAPSSDEEAAKATQSLAPQMPPVDPRRLRMVQDYSDVA